MQGIKNKGSFLGKIKTDNQVKLNKKLTYPESSTKC